MLECFIRKILASKYHQILFEKKWKITDWKGNTDVIKKKQKKKKWFSNIFVLSFMNAASFFVLGSIKKSYDKNLSNSNLPLYNKTSFI